MSLPVKMTDEIPKPVEGQIYKITKAETFNSQVRNYAGVRVELEDKKGNKFLEVLWVREIAGPKSKVGSFIVALGKEPAKWVGKTIRLTSWLEKNRAIQVV